MLSHRFKGLFISPWTFFAIRFLERGTDCLAIQPEKLAQCQAHNIGPYKYRNK